MAENTNNQPWYKEITQPFVDFVNSPRALWGVNISYLLEGFVYFGMLGYLAMYFTDYVKLSDTQAGPMVGFLTWGITFAMFLFGGLADKWGVRVAILLALFSMLVGRTILAGGSFMGLETGMWGPLHLVSLFGLMFVILGYGMYQPAAYAAVRLFTTPKTAGMGYAMLYALMNLGGWLPSFFAPVRKQIGINGAFGVYAGITLVTLVLTTIILNRRVVANAIAEAKRKLALEKATVGEDVENDAVKDDISTKAESFNLLKWLKNHPLADAKFTFFIFSLIPVQTLFAHNWLTLPMYVKRAFAGTGVGDNFEFAVNANPLLIFILVPIVTVLTQKKKVYNMMILGTTVMAAPTFLLAFGPSIWTLIGYLLIMTIGEAMWQPRFLQYAAEIAPEGRTGAYMGVAQFPWFFTKVITSLYSGWFLMKFCPDNTPIEALSTESMWLWYGVIAMASPVLLVVARPWLGKGFKEKA